MFYLTCSQTLYYFLCKVRRARVIKNKKRGGFIDRKGKGVGMEEEFRKEREDLRDLGFRCFRKEE